MCNEYFTAPCTGADKASGRALTPRTIFAVGSITKSSPRAVSSAWMIASASGCRSSRAARARTHPSVNSCGTSGIYNFTDNPMFAKAVDHGRSPWTPKRTLNYVKAPYFPPGKDFRYSNTNYILLGMAIERATGRPLAEQIPTLLLEPLGLELASLQAGSSGLADHAHATPPSTTICRTRTFRTGPRGFQTQDGPKRPGPPAEWPWTPARSPSEPTPSSAVGCWRSRCSTR